MLKNIHEANLFWAIALHCLGAWSLRQTLRHNDITPHLATVLIFDWQKNRGDFQFVSAFCFTRTKRWNETEIKQRRWNRQCSSFLSVLFRFYFACNRRFRYMLNKRQFRPHNV